MINTFFFGLLTVSLLGVTISLGYFTNLVFQNPTILDDIKELSAYSKIVASQRVSSKSLEILKFIAKFQELNGVSKIVIAKNGDIYKDINGKYEKIDENIILNIFSLKANNEITPEKESLFEGMLLQVPITYLRPVGVNEARLGQFYVLSLTPEGSAFVALKS